MFWTILIIVGIVIAVVVVIGFIYLLAISRKDGPPKPEDIKPRRNENEWEAYNRIQNETGNEAQFDWDRFK